MQSLAAFARLKRSRPPRTTFAAAWGSLGLACCLSATSASIVSLPERIEQPNARA